MPNNNPTKKNRSFSIHDCCGTLLCAIGCRSDEHLSVCVASGPLPKGKFTPSAANRSSVTVPSKFIHVRKLPNNITDAEIISLSLLFGAKSPMFSY
uniref:Uncharacterized protein n=1 Tax=Callorhinchus milii TaxID=7868 RepID=A0A4W3H2B9_CALMI